MTEEQAKQPVLDRGHVNMHRLGELLIEAAKITAPNTNGLVVSAPGALSIAARALNDMAAPLDTDSSGDDLREDFQDRIEEVQPSMAAYTLETFSKHLLKLSEAVAAGDAKVVGQFFNLYVFE